ncbi:MAG: DUF4402 domain-containing protein [Bacteroidota bacterium]
MVAVKKHKRFVSRLLLFFATGIILIYNPLASKAQEMPPRPVTVDMLQNLSFGGIALTDLGGTVTVTPSGSRYATGGVILVSQGFIYFPAIFELEGNPGTIIHPLFGPDIILTGSNGGSMTLHIDTSVPGDPLIINAAPPGKMQVIVGGTLHVGNMLANPPGSYTGVFTMMFIQE